MSATANATEPVPARARAAVLSTHPAVTIISSFFLAARRSAQAPRLGMVSMTMA